MQSFSRRARQCVDHTRRVSSLLTVAPLEQRTLGFSKIAYRVTKEPTWELVSFLRHADQDDPALHDILQRCGVSSDEWTRWSPVVYSPTFERAVALFQRHASHHTPSWVVLALASHKVRSPSDAQSALYDLALPLTSLSSPRPPIDKFHALPLLILTAHSLAYFSLVSLLRPLTSHIIGLPPHSHTHRSFHFNMLLQAISLFDRSRLAAAVAVDILKVMEHRGLTLWPNTERVLIRDNFRSPQLLDYFLRRSSSPLDQAEKLDKSEAWLRAYASSGKVQTSAYYLHSIRKQCLENGITPPYTTEDGLIDSDGGGEHIQGTAHKANTHYLRAMRDDRQSAFRYFHHLLKLDLSKPRQSPSVPDAAGKSNVDIYDWTTALYAGAHDRALSASALLDLFKATKQGTNAYKPTRATYTVVIQGLLWKNALEDAQKLWDEFVGEVVSARGKRDEEEMKIDRKALCVGIDVLVQSGRTEEALYLLDEAVKRDIEEVSLSPLNPALVTSASPMPNASSGSKSIRTPTTPYLKVHPIHSLFSALLRIRRPDAIFYIWTHLTSLYFIPPTNLMLRILLKAAMQASKMDGESFKGAMRWYIADNRLFKKQGGPIAPTMIPYKAIDLSENCNCEPGNEVLPCDTNPQSTEHTSIETVADGSSISRDTLAAHLRALLQTPTPPSVVGIWANRRSTEVARSIFRGMILGNWPALRGAAGPFGGGVTPARAKGSDSVFQELARVFAGRPTRFLPAHPTHLGTARPTMARPDVTDKQLGPPLPTVIPSESTFAAYIALLGLSSRAEEIPEVLMWMRALGVLPKTETLAVALVFWMEVGLRGPVFEDGWRAGVREDGATTTGDVPPRTEYGALRAWLREWVGEKRAPTEEAVCAGIKRVREMRDGQFGTRGGHMVVKDAKQRGDLATDVGVDGVV